MPEKPKFPKCEKYELEYYGQSVLSKTEKLELALSKAEQQGKLEQSFLPTGKNLGKIRVSKDDIIVILGAWEAMEIDGWQLNEKEIRLRERLKSQIKVKK